MPTTPIGSSCGALTDRWFANIKEPEAPTPTKEGKLAKQSKSAVKRAAKLAAQAGADELLKELRVAHQSGR